VSRCYEQLVRLKKKYPDRVVLLVGNRDVNKMRLTSELDDREMNLASMTKGESCTVRGSCAPPHSRLTRG
jgi:ERCC4-type nuclease